MGFEVFLARINNRGSARKRGEYGRVMHENEHSCRIGDARCMCRVLCASLYVYICSLCVVRMDSCVTHNRL